MPRSASCPLARHRWRSTIGLMEMAKDTHISNGNMREEFEREPQRILECIALHAERGERIGDATLQAMREAAPRLTDVPATEVFPALDRVLVSSVAGQTILDCQDVLATVIPELEPMAGCPQNTPYHVYDVLGHTAGVIDASPAVSISRWAALFHDVGKPQCRRVDAAGRDHFKEHARTGADIAHSTLMRIGAPQDFADDVCRLVYLHEWFPPETDDGVRYAIEELGGRVGLYRALLALQVADSHAKAPIAAERSDIARRFQSRLARLEGGSR